jgi:chromosome segregation ATPase
MVDENMDYTPRASATPRWLSLALAVPVVISGWALWSSASASRATQEAQQAAAAQSKALGSTVDQLQQRLLVSEQERRQAETQLAQVSNQINKTQGQLGVTRKHSKQFEEQYSKQLNDVENNVSGVKQELATKANGSDVDAMGNDVKGVRTDLDATKQNLQFARSEMGTLIARNHEEIDQLRRLGLRDYYEFTLEGKGSQKKVGAITVELRNTNTKKHSFTVDLLVDDMKLQKKNRSINEPLFFYTAGGRQSLELVVNQVGKNKVSGYLSVPKAAAPTPSSGN